jgi:hypothetical protein
MLVVCPTRKTCQSPLSPETIRRLEHFPGEVDTVSALPRASIHSYERSQASDLRGDTEGNAT